MITKIEKLKNIGNFEDYSASGDVTLKKLSIVYAHNGAGKTTLARVFHSLSTNDPSVVLRHKRINGTGNPEITFRNETPSPFVFSGTHWNRPCPDIEVFDAHFVANNVYSGFEINSDHHKALYQFVVGASGVAIVNKIERVKNMISAKNAEISQQAELIKATAGYHEVGQICGLVQKPNVDEEIAAKEKELSQAKSGEQIRTQAVPETITLPVFQFDYATIKAVLETTVEGIGQEYLQRVEAQLRQLQEAGMQNGQEWVFKGVAAKTTSCPFCGQDLKNAAELIDGYNQFFSEAYRKASLDANNAKRSFGALNIANYELQLATKYKQIEERLKYWNTVIVPETALPAFNIAELKLEEKYNALKAAIATKAGNPVGAVATDTLESFNNALGEVAKIVTAVNQYVAEYVAKITALRVKIRPVIDVEKELKALKIYKARYEQPLMGQCQLYGILNDQWARLQRINKKLQADQKAASAALFQQYGQKTNYYLQNVFMTPFQIADVKDVFRGSSKKPNLDYTLTFNGVPILQGDDGMSNLSFKNVLSEGDKNTIAFSFFLAKLTSDPNLANKIVVFDDPLTSLDQNRRSATINQLVLLLKRCQQLIVLSHNLHFLIELNGRNETSKGITKVVMIVKEENNARIDRYELKREWMDKYRRSIMKMEAFVEHPTPGEAQDEAISGIRLTLELMLKLKYGKYLSEQNGTFGEVIADLEREPCSFVNDDKAEVIDNLRKLNEAAWKPHHASVGERDVYQDEEMSMPEAVNYTKLALRLLYKEL